MKIRVSMDGKSLSAEVGDMADSLFVKIVNVVLGATGSEKLEDGVSKPSPNVKMKPVNECKNADEVKILPGLSYKGFILWKCKDCGIVRAFCMKKESKGVHCMSCNSDHLFEEPLKPIYAQCECGKSFKYMTNMDEETFDMDCLDCGSPIPIKWNEKNGIYETIRD